MPTKKDLEYADAAAAQVDWAKIDALDDVAIEAAVADDDDNPIAEGAEIADAMRVSPIGSAKIG